MSYHMGKRSALDSVLPMRCRQNSTDLRVHWQCASRSCAGIATVSTAPSTKLTCPRTRTTPGSPACLNNTCTMDVVYCMDTDAHGMLCNIYVLSGACCATRTRCPLPCWGRDGA